MASELEVDKISGTTTAGSISVTGEGNSTTTNLQQGLCKAWVQFDGDAADAAARDSNNVGSMTDHSTGTYSVNFTNNMANDDYAFAMAANNNDTGTGMVTGDSGHQTVVAVGSLKFSFTGASSNSVTDTIIGSAMIIGDLA
tara:strand:+ start:1885 stop:2307 length:423 start_codon:yes stop_codon:yes gene_type:complete